MSTLTGGDKVKILFSTSFISKTRYFILDEPTNNLDIDTIGWL